MKKLLVLLVILAILILAVMFDWFDSRHWADQGLDATESAIETLKDTGDKVTDTVETYRPKETPEP
ncbi:hypothetical protein [Thiomicrospira sp. WB1]|uniref:hypothetical protein n=1 Tax=Thiomicrospira sp. WB1 TaxID=1685380 RepID=UPI000749EA66|nr:hypothetical protein [Thiomicrospira sp. WB1]KUJ71245.1 hypothetical protein AVO41_10350 [Thiomicrospira sp. WB1]